MRRMVVLVAILGSATVLLADSSLQPLNIKPGLWEVTINMTFSGAGAPPGAPPRRTYRSCLKKEDLNRYPFVDPDKKCNYRVLSSSGSTMEAQGTCTENDGTKVDFKIRLDAVDGENVKGTGQLILSSAAGSLNGNYAGAGKWISSTCPANSR
jgi:hypothetical protein